MCPLLKVVEFRCETYSPAETWAKHFPNLETLSLRADGNGEDYRPLYRPTRLEAGRGAACTRVESNGGREEMSQRKLYDEVPCTISRKVRV